MCWLTTSEVAVNGDRVGNLWHWTATLFDMVEEPASMVDVKRMRLRYAGTCSSCGSALSAGTTADYDRVSKTVACVTCPPLGRQNEPDPPGPHVQVDQTVSGLATES